MIRGNVANPRLWRIATLALLCATIPAQAASYTTSGSGCGAFLGRPPQALTIVPMGLPVLGSTFSVDARRPVDQSWQFYWINFALVTGVSSTSFNGLRLPWVIPPSVVPSIAVNCTLYCSIDWVSRYGPPAPFSIPNHRSLLGVTLHQQWWAWYFITRSLSIDQYILTSDLGTMTLGR